MGLFIKKGKLTALVDEYGIQFFKDNECVAIAREAHGLYYLNTNTPSYPGQPPMLFMASNNKDPPADKNNDNGDDINPALEDFLNNPVWKEHRKYGHINLNYMIKMVGVIEGFPLTAKQIKAKIGLICPMCATTKAIVKIPRDPARRRYAEPGELVHFDIWGPYLIRGIDNAKYFLFRVDDATQFTWEGSLTTRKDLFIAFKKMFIRI